MGHFKGGWEPPAFGAGGGLAGAAGAAVGAGARVGGGAIVLCAWGGGSAMYWLGAAAGAGGCKASFFLITISQSCCFSCNSMMSLESTSLQIKRLCKDSTEKGVSTQDDDSTLKG